MWRAMFLAIGAYAFICGVECLAIDKAVLKSEEQRAGSLLSARSITSRQEIIPPQWAPWSLMSGGAVTILYSFTLPRRVTK